MSQAEPGAGGSPDLDSLLALSSPDTPAREIVAGNTDAVVSDGELLELDIDSVAPNEFQPRQKFDDDSLLALADSVRELGILQPILVRPDGPDRYELIAGERRWRAARLAGLGSVPAIVRLAEDQGSLEQAIVENLHREDLSAVEEAVAYQQLVEDFGLTQDQVAARVGKSRSAVTNTLRLLHLPVVIQEMVADGRLSAGHARAIVGVSDVEEQVALAERAVAEDLSVRAVEEAAKAAGRSSGEAAEVRPGGRKGSKSAAALEVERLLADRLATRVEVQESRGNGRIVIRFADREDLDRIYRLLDE